LITEYITIISVFSCSHNCSIFHHISNC